MTVQFTWLCNHFVAIFFSVLIKGIILNQKSLQCRLAHWGQFVSRPNLLIGVHHWQNTRAPQPHHSLRNGFASARPVWSTWQRFTGAQLSPGAPYQITSHHSPLAKCLLPNVISTWPNTTALYIIDLYITYFETTIHFKL